MATTAQTNYIQDLAVLKTKEFKEVKELLLSSKIVDLDSEVVMNAQTLAEICNALTDFQASRLIDGLVNAKAPQRSKVYAESRVKRTIGVLDDTKAIIDDWGF